MYFPDLSFDEFDPNTLNVGWLSAEHAFPTWDAPEDWLDRLALFLAAPAVVTLGWHDCEFCGKGQGTTEIRVFGVAPRVYAAPHLILHYVEDHRYRPPDEFIQAVWSSPAPFSAEYLARCAGHSWAGTIEMWREAKDTPMPSPKRIKPEVAVIVELYGHYFVNDDCQYCGGTREAAKYFKWQCKSQPS